MFIRDGENSLLSNGLKRPPRQVVSAVKVIMGVEQFPKLATSGAGLAEDAAFIEETLIVKVIRRNKIQRKTYQEG